MFQSLLLSGEIGSSQRGIPGWVWIVVAGIVAIVLLIISIKSFWVSKTIAFLLGALGVVIGIQVMTGNTELFGIVASVQEMLEAIDPQFVINPYLVCSIVCGLILVVIWVFLLGNMVFDSGTEGDYLIAGTLVHDTNHPLAAFFGYLGGAIALAFFVFWAAYAWTFIIGLVVFILVLILDVLLVVERVRG